VCRTSILSLIQWTTEAIEKSLNGVANGFIIQCEKALMHEQKRSDFRPRFVHVGTGVGSNGSNTTTNNNNSVGNSNNNSNKGNKNVNAKNTVNNNSNSNNVTTDATAAAAAAANAEALAALSEAEAKFLEKNTQACIIVVEMLRAMGHKAKQITSESNRASFLVDIGTTMCATLTNHMQQFTFSQLGAMRWKGDLSAYTAALRGWGLSQLQGPVERLSDISGLLLVAPEQLPSLINSTLRMAPREAMKFVKLREDFSTTKIDGKSLQEILNIDSGFDSFMSMGIPDTGVTQGNGGRRR